MLSTLLDHFPPVSEYSNFVDAYGGAGTVILNKPYCPVEIYNDLNQDVYSLYKVLQDSVDFYLFKQRAELSVFSEQVSEDYRQSLRSGEEMTHQERAFRFWYVNRTRRSGSGGLSINSVIRRNMSKSTSDFLSAIERLPELHQRISTMIILNRNAIELIKDWDNGRTFIYLDPPYVWSTRGSTRYPTDCDDDHHIELVETVLEMKRAMIMISGYDNPLYQPLVNNGWRRVDVEVSVVDGKNEKKTKVESMWMNYPDFTKPEQKPMF